MHSYRTLLEYLFIRSPDMTVTLQRHTSTMDCLYKVNRTFSETSGVAS